MNDLISRQALLKQIDIDSDGEPGYYGDTWKFIDTIKNMPPALSTNLAEVGTNLISRQQAIDAMANTLWHYPNECYRNLNEYEFAKGLAELGLKSVPSAQPKIIRCKDCLMHGVCRFERGLGLDGYCSQAERRTDERSD